MKNEPEKLDLEILPSPVLKDNFQPPSPYVNEPVPEFDDSADIRDYLEMMLRRRWLILTILLVSIVTTFIVSLTMKPQYRANGEIELTIQSPHVTKFEDMNMLSTQIQTREFMQTNLNLLKSVTLADRVINKLGLDHNPAFNPPPEQPGAISELISSAKAAVKDFFARLFPYTGTTVTGAGDPRLPGIETAKNNRG